MDGLWSRVVDVASIVALVAAGVGIWQIWRRIRDDAALRSSDLEVVCTEADHGLTLSIRWTGANQAESFVVLARPVFPRNVEIAIHQAEQEPTWARSVRAPLWRGFDFRARSSSPSVTAILFLRGQTEHLTRVCVDLRLISTATERTVVRRRTWYSATAH